MKTLTFMAFVGLMFCAPSLHAQKKQVRKTTPFVRVFNAEGKKLTKGYLISVEKENAIIEKGRRSTSVPIDQIQHLKLKRSFGHKLAKGALTGAAIGTALAVTIDVSSSGDTFTEDLGYGLLPLGGTIGGTTVGGIIGLLSKPLTVEINGDANQLKTFFGVMKTY